MDNIYILHGLIFPETIQYDILDSAFLRYDVSNHAKISIIQYIAPRYAALMSWHRFITSTLRVCCEPGRHFKFELKIAARHIFLEEHWPKKLPIHGLYARVARDSCLPCKRYCRAASRAAACCVPVALPVASHWHVNVPLHCMVIPLWPHYAIWPHRFGNIDLVNIGSGNGLVPLGTKPLPEPLLTYHHQSPMSFIWRHCHKEIWRNQSVKCDGKLHFWKSHPDLPGAMPYKL